VDRLQRHAGNAAILRLVSARGSHDTPVVSPGLESYIAGSRTGGEPLPASTRAYFEPRFGRDLEDVRLHADDRAAGAAAEIGAHAFTSGSDVYFGAGQLQPGTPRGDRLLAHELTHVVQQTGRIQRQPTTTTTAMPTAADYRDFVNEAIRFFRAGERLYSRAATPMDRATFDRIMNGWYGMVVRQEGIIATQLAADAALTRDLQAAYTTGIHAVLAKASTKLGKNLDDLFRENSGRMPLWAWQVPHHMERGISIPIAQGRTVNRSGDVVFTTNGIRVTIKPNLIDTSLTTAGRTRVAVTFRAPGRTFDASGQGHVGAVQTPTATIRVRFRSAADASAASGYGRGTTSEDVAGGAVTPRSLTVGFHEGTHGLAYVEFIEKNPFPTFTGTATMTTSEFEAAQTLYENEANAYIARMEAFNREKVHCVGTTIDQFNAAQGRTAVIECGGP
jgi:hypothetical protein